MATLLTAEQQAYGRSLLTKFDQLEGFVPGEGSRNPVLVMVSEAPGRTEARVGHPFQGPAGIELDRWLTQLDLTRAQVYLTGAVRSRPYRVGKSGQKRDRRPSRVEVEASAPLLDAELAELKGRLLVPLGNTGLQRLLGSKFKISAVHGQLLKLPVRCWNAGQGRFETTATTYPIFPLYHPSYSKRFKKFLPVVNRDLEVLADYLQESRLN
ncbi:uracil-DNA glycosylase [Lactiplantibacillus garii]|uniref:uracil-DNA glycosylase n=1 Tax=Lactiplantibacillus garii TaxID=2306423 RepID=UPI001CDB8A57|nr:uracil-DNA glycosylase [Lactiplantibacillus garii]